MHHRNRISVNLFRCFIFKMKAARLILKIFLVISVTVALTIMTQVGGVIYLASLLLYLFIKKDLELPFPYTLTRHKLHLQSWPDFIMRNSFEEIRVILRRIMYRHSSIESKIL